MVERLEPGRRERVQEHARLDRALSGLLFSFDDQKPRTPSTKIGHAKRAQPGLCRRSHATSLTVGVIVPAALTDDEAVAIGADAASTIPKDQTEVAPCVRQGLERIARGER